VLHFSIAHLPTLPFFAAKFRIRIFSYHVTFAPFVVNVFFGCGSAALGLCDEYSSTSMILHGPPFDLQ
jgi:hypothetical protein